MITGAGLGGAAMHGLHAQAKPPVYQITEVDIHDHEGYHKEFAPRAVAALEAAGAKFLVRGGTTHPFVGEPPKRIVVLVWDNIDKARAYGETAAAKELPPLLQKYGRVQRSFAAEGVSR
jgi:uncharacterized protein (DUF1330 family)